MSYYIRIARQERPPKSNRGKLHIYFRLFPLSEMKGKDFIVSTRVSVETENLNRQRKLAKGNNPTSNRINDLLRNREEEVQCCFDEYIRLRSNPNMADFKKFLNYKLFNVGEELEPKVYVNDAFERYVNNHSSDLCPIRKQRYDFVRRQVAAFNTIKYGKADVEIQHLNRDWYFQFREFLLGRRPYKTETLTGYLKVLRAVVRDAFRSELISKYPFENCKMDYDKPEVRYLNKSELEKILTFYDDNPRLQSVADCFVFATQTGLSHSDLRSLSYSMIKQEGQNFYIEKEREKTGVLSIIPLSPIALGIMEKYKKHPKLAGTDLVLPVLLLNDYNRLLKVIAAKSGLNCSLTSHMARHSMATTVWLSMNGATVDVLQRILGHKNIKTTQRYGEIKHNRVINEAQTVFAKPK